MRTAGIDAIPPTTCSEAVPGALPILVLPVAERRELPIETEMAFVVHGTCEAGAARTVQLAVVLGPALVVAVDDPLCAFTRLQEPSRAQRVDPHDPLVGVHDSGGDKRGTLLRVLVALEELHVGDAAARLLELEADVSAADGPHAQRFARQVSLDHRDAVIRLLVVGRLAFL